MQALELEKIMGLFQKLFNNKADSSDNKDVSISANSNDSEPIISISYDSYVNRTTGSTSNDFYVYEWFVKESGEVFYVGKGRGDRYKKYHERAYEAEKIRQLYNTDSRFVAQNLTEEQALEIEQKEMLRILNETNDVLTNRVVPLRAKRDNGYSKSKTTPEYRFETAPFLYACEIDEHYFGINGKPFDTVDISNLSKPSFIDKLMSDEESEIVYGDDYNKYYQEVLTLLEQNGSKIISSRYAKSVTAWIYTSDDYVINNNIDEEKAMQTLGRTIPSYHLIDVWKALKKIYKDKEINQDDPITINPINSRVPLNEIKNLNDRDAGYDAGYKYWEQGEEERKQGNIDKAIEFFDKARFNGYSEYALYNSYAMAYRKKKDLDNEIAILEEGIERFTDAEEMFYKAPIMLKEQRDKAIKKLKKQTE